MRLSPVRILLSLLVLLSLCLSIEAQDTIIKKDGEQIKAKIIEVNEAEIKYYEVNDMDNLLFTMDRNLIDEIMFGSDRMVKAQRASNNYEDDRINNLKFNFVALAGRNIILTYERALNPKSSFETTLKMYDFGNDAFEIDRSGFGFYFGYKRKLSSIFKYIDLYNTKHILRGGYIRYVAGYSYSKIEDNFQFGGFSETDSYGHVGLELGQQWIVQNTVSLDIYMGGHYYAGSFKTNDPSTLRFPIYSSIQNGDLFGGRNLAFAIGLRVGGLFVKRGKDKSKKNK